MNRLPALLLALVAALAFSACDSSPTEITDGPLVFDGVLAEDEVLIFSFVITRSGGVRIEATSIVADPPPDDGEIVSIGTGIGEFDDAGVCIVSVSANLLEGQRMALGLSEREYCLRVFDNGTLEEDETHTFSVLVAPAE